MYRHEWKAYYTTLERKLMGAYIVHFRGLYSSPACRTFGARRDAFLVQAAHRMLLPKAAHGVGGLYGSRRGNGAGGPVLPLGRFTGSYIDCYVYCIRSSASWLVSYFVVRHVQYVRHKSEAGALYYNIFYKPGHYQDLWISALQTAFYRLAWYMVITR
jgi:hypothetical protein